jgi:hypothetical protein
MELPKWLGWVALIGAMLTQLVAEATEIKPIYGLIVTVVAGAIALFTSSVMKNIYQAGKGWTVAGALLIASALATYLASPDWISLIGPEWIERLGSIGVLLSVIGQGLKSGPPQIVTDDSEPQP